ncbi:MAG: NADH-quinone oxidoreductase subunit NuoF [Armatimonadetes bacterium]|nr:NADH-quinone oxidoreductase subunit NuoF [Armatimonadota bacterium]
MANEIVFSRNHIDNVKDLDVYVGNGGYSSLQKGLTMAPDELIELVKASGLRGRGGAGFPTGMKWSFVPKDTSKPHYLVCNADESEPGTFKDRQLMEVNPHQLLEGMILACHAIGAKTGFIYIRGEFVGPIQIVSRAIEQAYARGYLGKNIQGTGVDVDLAVHPGAGAYIWGEESALLNSLEGQRGLPRLKPPFPAVSGLYASPTIINNVETLANISHIVNNGADWFKQWGTERSAGTKVVSISGHVNRPGNYEVPLATPMMTLINEFAGGVRDGHKLKAVIPGGSSVPILPAEKCDINYDYESIQAAGSMLGSAGMIVMDETTCMVGVARNLVHFYRHESCGKCTPCREGTDWMFKILNELELTGGQMDDIDLLLDITDNMDGKCFCPLGDTSIMSVVSGIEHWRHEFEEHVRNGGCQQRAQNGH